MAHIGRINIENIVYKNLPKEEMSGDTVNFAYQNLQAHIKSTMHRLAESHTPFSKRLRHETVSISPEDIVVTLSAVEGMCQVYDPIIELRSNRTPIVRLRKELSAIVKDSVKRRDEYKPHFNADVVQYAIPRRM